MQSVRTIHQRYRLLRPLGKGGFGRVWLAEDLQLNRRQVAIKENLDLQSSEGLGQFRLESGLLAKLNHPFLPSVYELIENSEGQWLVMAFIDGQTLDDIVKAGTVTEANALRWINQVMEAVTYLHSRTPSVIHRDIKPANIRITPDGHAVLVDFGIAKEYSLNRSTQRGARAASPEFAPPEQILHRGTDQRSDVYSIGATLYYTLAGVAPADAMTRSQGSPLGDLRKINKTVSRNTAAAIERALAMNADERWQSVSEFQAALGAPGPRISAPLVTPPTLPSALTIAVTGLAASVIILGLIALTLMWSTRSRAGEGPPTPLGLNPPPTALAVTVVGVAVTTANATPEAPVNDQSASVGLQATSTAKPTVKPTVTSTRVPTRPASVTPVVVTLFLTATPLPPPPPPPQNNPPAPTDVPKPPQQPPPPPPPPPPAPRQGCAMDPVTGGCK